MVEKNPKLASVIHMAQRRTDVEKVLQAVAALRIERALERAGWALEKLAGEAGVRYGAAYGYLHGTRLPNVIAGLRIARALKVDAADLFLKPATVEERKELVKRGVELAA